MLFFCKTPCYIVPFMFIPACIIGTSSIMNLKLPQELRRSTIVLSIRFSSPLLSFQEPYLLPHIISVTRLCLGGQRFYHLLALYFTRFSPHIVDRAYVSADLGIRRYAYRLCFSLYTISLFPGYGASARVSCFPSLREFGHVFLHHIRPCLGSRPALPEKNQPQLSVRGFLRTS